MDLDECFAGKNITESSKKLYVKNLIRLNGGVIPKTLKFLDCVDDIKQRIQKYKPNTQRSYIITIVSLLKGCKDKQPKKYSKLYDKYYEILTDMNKNLKDATQKTDKEEQNWIGQDAVKEKMEEELKLLDEIKDKKKLSPEEYEKLLHLVVLGLFVLQKPRRNKDYQECFVVKKYKDDMGTEKNFLDLFKNEFIFNNYKTQGKYQTQIIGLEPKMRDIIDCYLLYHPLKKQLVKDNQLPFLVNYQGEPFTQINSLTRMLYKIFSKKIGSSMLRKLYLTDKYRDILNEMKDDVKSMGTSTGTAETNYIKN